MLQRLKRLRERSRQLMQRTWMIGAVLALLALPLAVGAQSLEGMNCRSWDDTGCMPSWWTPYPPASKRVDGAQLAEALHAKGVITDQEYARLTQPQVSAPLWQGQGTGWTWEELDRRQGSPAFGGSDD